MRNCWYIDGVFRGREANEARQLRDKNDMLVAVTAVLGIWVD